MSFQPPKGMRDFLPAEAAKLNFVLDIVRGVFERYGFVQLDTPCVEGFDLLSAKGGLGEGVRDEIYNFRDKSGRELGLRFDLTMPLARVVISNPNLPKPFKRWQIGKVWRYDNPQAKRYREFYQADIDIVGTDSPVADAEILAVAVDCLTGLGFKDVRIRVNNRKLTEFVMKKLGVPEGKIKEVFRSVDKLVKIGAKGVEQELKSIGLKPAIIKKLFEFISISDNILDKIEKQYGTCDGIKELAELIKSAEIFGIGKWIQLDMSLVRGLDYYTGNVFEVMIGDEKLTMAAGGRFDNLIGALGGKSSPAVGISFGVDRILQVMNERGMLKEKPATRIFVAAVSNAMRDEALKIAKELRSKGIAAETDLLSRKLPKQLEYAAALCIPFVAIIGPAELKEGKIKLRDMASGTEQLLSTEALVERFRHHRPLNLNNTC